MGGASPTGAVPPLMSTKAGRCSFLALAVEPGTGSGVTIRAPALVPTRPGDRWMPSIARASGWRRRLSLVANPLVAIRASSPGMGSALIQATISTSLTLTDGSGGASATDRSASGAVVVATWRDAGVGLNVDVHHHPPATAPASRTMAPANR